MKSRESARRGLVFRDASCDFVDRPLPSKQKNSKWPTTRSRYWPH